MALNTPLLSKLKNNGTFYIFQSAGEDLSFSQGRNELNFSKFVCLNIPAIQAPVDGSNTIQFQNIEGSFTQGLSTDGPPPEGDRTDLAESLQNYVYNLEEIIIRDPNYNSELGRTVSERVFFKWLKEIGAVRFRNSVQGEKRNGLADQKFSEEANNADNGQGDIYSRVVTYIGDIDIDNAVRANQNSYRQLFFYIPKQVGNTPVVLFDSIEDENYGPGRVFRNTDQDNIELIGGRDISDNNPTEAGLRINAFYDQDLPIGAYDYTVNGGSAPLWFEAVSNGPNAYYTEATFADPATDTILREDPNNIIADYTYRRSRLDGISIDFDTANYQAFSDNALLRNFPDFSATPISDSFEFNAIAIYYDVDNPDGSTVRNLYGVLFLDNLVIEGTNGGKVPTYLKTKPSEVLQTQGNGFGISANIAVDVVSGSTMQNAEVTVNDYSTFSMTLFAEALSQVKIANTRFEELLLQNQGLLQRVQDLEALILSGQRADEIENRVAELEQANIDELNETGLLELINTNTQKINEILAGDTEVNVNTIFEALGRGGIQTIVNQSQLIIENRRQKWSRVVERPFELRPSVQRDNTFELGAWDTLIVHDAGSSDIIESQSDIIIFLKDSPNQWRINQEVKIVFKTPIDFQGRSIFIRTDFLNLQGSGVLGFAIGNVTPRSQYPIVNVVCKDPINYTFTVYVEN